MEKPPILSDKEKERAIERWNRMSLEERDEAISRSYYGIDKILRRFVETGCFNEQNPDQNQNWCSCGKPFCYSCVAYQITRKIEPLIQQARAEVAREIVEVYDCYIKLLGEEIDSLMGLAITHGWMSSMIEAGEKCRVDIQSLKSKYTGGQK